MSQSLSQQWIHIIFSTKDRFRYFNDEIILNKIHQHIQDTCIRLHCHPYAIGGIDDHIHLLVNLNKNTSLSQFIEGIKKSSSKWLKLQSNLNSDLSKFYWQRGYGAFSVSQSALNDVKAYIDDQRRHHQKHTFQEELRIFLLKHNVPFNEEYLWL